MRPDRGQLKQADVDTLYERIRPFGAKTGRQAKEGDQLAEGVVSTHTCSIGSLSPGH